MSVPGIGRRPRRPKIGRMALGTPRMTKQSPMLIDAAATRTSTWSAAGAGCSTSRTSRTSAGLAVPFLNECLHRLPSSRCLAQGAPHRRRCLPLRRPVPWRRRWASRNADHGRGRQVRYRVRELPSRPQPLSSRGRFLRVGVAQSGRAPLPRWHVGPNSVSRSSPLPVATPSGELTTAWAWSGREGSRQ